MSSLSKSEQAELLALIAKEWAARPELTFQGLVNEFTYIAVGYTDLLDHDERKFLEALREGWRTL